MTAALARPVWMSVTCLLLATFAPADGGRHEISPTRPAPAVASGPAAPAHRVSPGARRATRGGARPRPVVRGTPVRTVGVTVTVIPGVPPPPITSFALDPAFPNPASSSTTIRYSLPSAGRLTLRVYDLGGKLVAELVTADQAPGRYSVRWDRTDGRGRLVRAGLYFYRAAIAYASGGHWSATRKLTLR